VILAIVNSRESLMEDSSMKTRFCRAVLVFLAVCVALPSAVQAGGGVRVGIGVGIGPGFYRPYPYPYYPGYYPYGYYPYYAPPPVYVVPGPTYVQGPPNYVQGPTGPTSYMQTVPSQQQTFAQSGTTNLYPSTATPAAGSAPATSAPHYLPPPPQPGYAPQQSDPNAPPPYPVPSGS
jgi:hypothetical protein